MIEYNPYNAGVVGGSPQDIAVQIQSDLAKSEMFLVGLVFRDIVRPNHPASRGIQEFLHSLSVMQKLELIDELCRSVDPDRSHDTINKSRKVIKRHLTRFAQIRNKLSHCTKAEIHGDVVVIFEDRIGSNALETRIEMAELEEYVGPKWLDIIDEMKFLFAELDPPS